MNGIAALISFCVLSFLLVGLYRWLALRFRWLDFPNQRSSHQTITPRGAGLIFALLIVAATVWSLPYRPTYCLLAIPLLGVMLIGWLDDIRGISACARFVAYITLAAASVYLILQMTSGPDQLGVIALLLYCSITTIGLTWLINLYNFMDGINGLATCEAIFVLLGIIWLGHGTAYADTFEQLHLSGSAALAGFLLWNLPAGKVFMGDAGSAFLGLLFGVLMLWSHELQGPSLAIWLILLAVFIADTGYTLLVRVITGQRWHTAHRLHAYQRLTDRLNASHIRATGVIMAINLCWLLPMAWLVQNSWISNAWGLALAYMPLLTTGYCLKAGIPPRGEV